MASDASPSGSMEELASSTSRDEPLSPATTVESTLFEEEEGEDGVQDSALSMDDEGEEKDTRGRTSTKPYQMEGVDGTGHATPRMHDSHHSPPIPADDPAQQYSSSSSVVQQQQPSPYYPSYMQNLGRGSAPPSGASTPRRRASVTDLGDEAARREINNRLHQHAVFGFTDSNLANRFDGMSVKNQSQSQSQTPINLSPTVSNDFKDGGFQASQDDDSEMENGLDEEDVPIPDSRQAKAAAMEVVEGHREG